MVEATMVLPMVVLILVSLLCMATIYFIGAIGQFKAREEVIDETNQSNSVYGVVEKDLNSAGVLVGLNPRSISQETTCRAYQLNEVKMMYMGDSVVNGMEK